MLETRVYLTKARGQLQKMAEEAIGLDEDCRYFAEDALAQFGLALSMLEATLAERGAAAGPREVPGSTAMARELVRSFVPHARARLDELGARFAYEVTPAGLPLFEEIFSELAMALDVLQVLDQHLAGADARPAGGTEIITILRDDGVIEYESAAIKEVLGYSSTELVGRRAFDFIHPQDLAMVFEAFAEGLRTPGRAIAVRYRFRHRDGSWRGMHSVARNVVRNSRPVGYVVRSHAAPEHLRLPGAVAA